MKIDIDNTGIVPSYLTYFGKRGLDLFNEPVLMGILNVTPDSFSDGGKFSGIEQAVGHAKKMVEEGATIIDIGGESTRPGSSFVSVEEELSRVIPVLEAIKKEMPDVLVSVDTNKAVVAELAIQKGADMINDVSAGTFDKEMLSVVARYGVPICLMHTKDTPDVMQNSTKYEDLIADIYQFLYSRIEAAVKAGISRVKIIIDPGIGFGKDTQQNLQIIRELEVFKGLGCPVLLGTSRKNFIGQVTGKGITDRAFGTAATITIGVLNGAGILRVHDVKEMRDTIVMTKAIQKVVGKR
jgi:dihydropteroate synthase